MHRISTVAAAALVCSAISAQSSPFASEWRPSRVDSGVHHNTTNLPRVVFERVVRATSAPWVRLIVDEASLPNTSHLEVISVQDGHRQRIDRAELARWANRSAYFNGEMLIVRLIAAPHSTGVSFKTSAIEAGLRENVVDPLSQCGPADDRVPSTDKRTGRLLPSGCTAWLISNRNCFITAGHCRSSSQMTVQFNVPLSNSNGQINHPGPQDQYPVNGATVNGTTGGVGNDWAVFQTRANGTTNRHAGQVQGAFFKVAFTKPAVNRTIRITGYGVDRDNRTRNQTNQTHTGPLRTNGGTRLCYFTDTEGGNSGSPVIDEATGDAVGVHTHGGCSTNGTGCNSGTSTTNTAFANAVRGLQCEPPLCTNEASFTAFGSGCRGTGKQPAECMTANVNGNLRGSSGFADITYLLELTAPRALQVQGFEIKQASRRAGTVTVPAFLYSATATGQPNQVLASGTMTVGSAAAFYRVTLNRTVSIAQGQRFFIGFRNANPTITVGTQNPGAVVPYWRNNGANNSWVRFATLAWGYKVLCVSSGNATPVLANDGAPRLGDTFRVNLSLAKENTAAILFIGLSRSQWGAITLPFDLTGLGAGGCFVRVSGDIMAVQTTSASGGASFPVALPRDKNLCNKHVFFQYVVLDQAANNLGYVFTNGGDALNGN